MNKKSFSELLDGYINDALTSEEFAEFQRLLEQPAHYKLLEEQIGLALQNPDNTGLAPTEKVEIIFNNILKTNEEQKEGAPVYSIRRSLNHRWWIAAAVILLAGLLLAFFLFTPTKHNVPQVASQKTKKARPGGNKAVLTLANGSTIILDTVGNGVLSQQGGVKILNFNGQLSYDNVDKTVTAPAYNMIATPRGGQYQLVLSDGSKVWLNASSSLRFPAAFAGSSHRRVELTGEAYFEIAKQAMPFEVVTERCTIEVLGTHFNVNGYTNEQALATTLLEGAVRIHGEKTDVLLRPGEQAILKGNDEFVKTANADIEQAVAWKNGLFHFQSDELSTILRQVERWYDVDAQIQGNINEHFTGQAYRSAELSDLLKILELTGKVRFELKGNKLIARPL